MKRSWGCVQLGSQFTLKEEVLDQTEVVMSLCCRSGILDSRITVFLLLESICGAGASGGHRRRRSFVLLSKVGITLTGLFCMWVNMLKVCWLELWVRRYKDAIALSRGMTEKGLQARHGWSGWLEWGAFPKPQPVSSGIAIRSTERRSVREKQNTNNRAKTDNSWA
jgi:hypothetical protein